MSKLWQKDKQVLHPLVADYIVEKDLASDKALLPYDVKASIAHAQMLAQVGLISEKEGEQLSKELLAILSLVKSGQFTVTMEDEDVHTAIENHLVKQLGDLGKKIHTGRSRNDQVLVAMRLFTKDHLQTLQSSVLTSAEKILAFAQKHEFVPMPGYTHTQRAMPSSVGQWAGAFVESLLDDFKILQAAHDLIDQNPLGSAAGFGTTLPIDRALTTQLMGFDHIQNNTLYCQNSRGKFEAFVVHALVQVMMTLGKIANDLLWFTSQEFDFFKVDFQLATGSSIMPQKKNFDIFEVMRANVSVVMAHQMQIQSVTLPLISGYHKDLKVTKKPLMESLKIVHKSLELIPVIFSCLTPNKSKLEAALEPHIFATDEVNEKVKKGVPFRDAYRTVGQSLGKVQKKDALKNLKSKTHQGAPGNLGLNECKKRIISFRKSLV